MSNAGATLARLQTDTRRTDMTVRPVPEGYSTVTPYLIIDGAADAIAFYTRAFGAQELMRFGGPDGKIGHAELQIGDSRIMLADEHPQMGYRSPKALGGSATSIMLYVDDVDRVFRRAVEAGAQTQQELKNQFYGDRSGTVTDPFGHVWTIATHIEDVSEEEMQRRMEASMTAHATS
jgi:PhnB protein